MLTQCTSSTTTKPTPAACSASTKLVLPQPLRGRVQQPVPALGEPGDAPRGLLGRQRRVDERRHRCQLRRQLVHLVLHERDERRQHERRTRPEHRRELVRERLAGARRHQRERVRTGDGCADDPLLPGPEGREAEVPLEGGEQLAHPNECTVAVGRPRAVSGADPPRVRAESVTNVCRWIGRARSARLRPAR